MNIHGQPRAPHSGVMGSIIKNSFKLAVAASLPFMMGMESSEGCGGFYEPGPPDPPTPAHWSRIDWQQRASAIAGNTPDNLMIVGERGLVVSLDTHERQTSATTDNFSAAWAGDGVAFAVGMHGSASRFDGSTWTSIPTGSNTDLRGVWGTGGNNVYAVGAYGTIAHFNGSSWSVSFIPGGVYFMSVWGFASNDVFAVGSTGGNPETAVVFHYDGRNWERMDCPGSLLRDVWGTSHADVFAVGGSRTIVHYDGQRWSTMLPSDSYAYLNAVWGTSPGDVYAVGYGGAYMHYDGQEWAQAFLTSAHLIDIGGSGPDDIYILEGSNPAPVILHYAGVEWSEEPLYLAHGLNAIFTDRWSNAYAVGDAGTILHKTDYSTVSAMPSGTTENLNSVWRIRDEELVAVGDAGTILHYSGNAWHTAESPTTAALRDVWSWPGAEAYAVGDAGTILQYKNQVWTPMTSGVTTNLNAVWGVTSQDIYAVGDAGIVVRFDGTRWNRLNPPTKQDLLGAWVGPGGGAVVVGRKGTFLTRSSTWTAFATPPVGDLRAVWGDNFSDLHIAATSTFLRFNGKRVAEMHNVGLVHGSLTALHGSNRFDVLAVSDDGFLYQFYVRN